MPDQESEPSSAIPSAPPGASIFEQLFGDTIMTVPSVEGDDLGTVMGLPSVIGRFEIRRLLGRGSFGMVCLGFDSKLDREVAIKIPTLSAQTPLSDEVENALIQEARQLAKLKHANIVAVHDVGCDNGNCFIVSEYLTGSDLGQWIHDNQLNWQDSVRMVLPLLDALEEAHSLGIIHRDVKPANIIVTERAEGWVPVLVDFGLALSHLNVTEVSNRRGHVSGTPHYMSPEQARGEGHRIDGRTDIYSIGVILYRMLSGRLPFSGQNVPEILRAVAEDEPCPPRQFVRAIPRELERICLSAMSKSLIDRYTTAGDMAAELRIVLKEYEDASEAPVTKALREAKRPRAADGMRILIAEDDEISRFKLQSDLEKWGHEVVVAESGDIAWKIFQDEEFSIVITDWLMPNMDGLELVQRIRGVNRQDYVFIIMLTAKAGKHDIVAGIGAGADDFLTKPFHRDELKVRLRAGHRITVLNRDLVRANRRMKQHLEAAGQLQRAYLPQAMPVMPGYEVAWDWCASDELSGAMLNVLPLDSNQFGLYVLDVNGQGVSASLLATTVARSLAPGHDLSSLCFDSRGQVTQVEINEPEVVAAKLGRQFSGHEFMPQFFTLTYGILNLKTRQFRYTCAGHPPILRQRAGGDIECLESFGLPIGLSGDGDDSCQETVQLERGDRLFLYSKGILDIQNSGGGPFGEAALMNSVKNHSRQGLAEAVRGIKADVVAWTGRSEMNAAMCILALEVL